METGKRNYGAEFEEEVREFLSEKLRFSDVKGGPNFHIAKDGEKNQIDACGRYEDILFIFECKAAGRKIKGNLRDEILETRERARIAFVNFRNIPEYSKCTVLKFVFITKKIKLPESEINLFKDKEGHIWYADEQLLEYYADLCDKIGSYAVYNFLADYGIRPKKDEFLNLPALRTKLGKHVVYNFYTRPKKLLKFSYVARRRSQKENFYQRMLDKARIQKIQGFLDGGGIFPTNVIISLREGTHFFKPVSSARVEDLDVGILTIRDSYSACWIIDGQHRLYSFANSKSNNLIPCIAFDNISIEDERKFFLEINREQRPIQADLIWDLEGLANPETPRGIISNIVRTLDNREPFLNKIYIPVRGTKTDKFINMAAFCNGISNAQLTKQIAPNCVGIENPLYAPTIEARVARISRVLQHYFSNIKLNLGEGHFDFIFGNAGIPIMLYVLEPIISFLRRTPREEDLKDYSREIAKFFVENYPTVREMRSLRAEANSEGARRGIARHIGLYIRREMKIREFWPNMEQNELVDDIIDMERRIGSLIANQLSKLTTAWETQKVPQTISFTTRQKAQRDGTRFDENLDLGSELQIIAQESNWRDAFEKIFIGKEGFSSKDELRVAFNSLAKIRNPALHGKSTSVSKDDLSLCEIYLAKFIRTVPEIIPEHLANLEENCEK